MLMTMNFDKILSDFLKALEEKAELKEKQAQKEAAAFHLDLEKEEMLGYIPDWCPYIVIKNFFDTKEDAEKYLNNLNKVVPFNLEGSVRIKYQIHNGPVKEGNFGIYIVPGREMCIVSRLDDTILKEEDVLINVDGIYRYMNPSEIEVNFKSVEKAVEKTVNCIEIKHNMTFEEAQEALDFFGIDFFIFPKRSVITSAAFDDVVVVKENGEPIVRTLHVEFKANDKKVEASFKADGKEIIEGNFLCDTKEELDGYTLISAKDMEELNKEVEEPCKECDELNIIELPIREDTVDQEFPIKLDTFPNYLGINLCSVESEKVIFKGGEPIAVSTIFKPYKADYSNTKVVTKVKDFAIKPSMYSDTFKNFNPVIETRVLTADDQIISLTYTV